MNNDWRKEQEKGSPFFLGLVCWVALHLGRRAIYIMLMPIVFYYFLSARKVRQASYQFLTRALSHKPGWLMVYRHLFNFARVSVDRIFFLAGKEKQFDVRIYGHEVLEEFSGKGCVMITSHFGSFDVMRVVGVREQALKLRILLDIKHNARALHLIQQLDPVLAAGIIDAQTPGTELVLKLSEAIANAEHVGIMADRAGKDERTTSINFLGEAALFPEGSWYLASLLQSPVIACFGVYRGGNRYDLHVELIAAQLGNSRRDRAEAIAIGMQTYARRLEYYAQTYPLNWFNFYDFWQHESITHH
jgi:predicted LPLAT superfamily acyltransferase